MSATRYPHMLANPPRAGGILLLLAVAVLVVTGCVESQPRYAAVLPTPLPTATATSIPEPTVTPTPTIVPVPSPMSVPTATPAPPPPTPTPTPTLVPVATATSTPVVAIPTATAPANSDTFNLRLDFEGLSNENVIRSDTVVLRGITTPDAVVSVNGVIVQVQADGTFELTLVLETDAPNEVVVIASDISGNTASSTLIIVSIPPDLEESE